MKPELEKLADELLKTYGKDIEKGRKKELAVELKMSLNKLANRIDRGFQIEMRISEEAAEVEDDDSENTAALRQILDSYSSIEQHGIVSEPVLSLPEQLDEEK